MSAGALSHDLQDTIAAIATGKMAAPRAIVRLTGPQVVDVVRQVFAMDHPATLPERLPHRLVGRVRIQAVVEGKPSAALASTMPTSTMPTSTMPVSTMPADLWYWPSHRTYTGQPSAEFHLPGAPYLVEQLLQECLRLGARLAAPGEFTMRAFLAGRLDLLQAQAVLQVIEANSDAQLQAALGQLAGGLSAPLQGLRDQLIMVLAHLEAGLDFVEEDIEFISREQLLGDLQTVRDQVGRLLDQLRQRGELGALPRVVLVGPPNAGKSSLFNSLLGESAAIVSPQRGTTRDYLSGRLKLTGGEVELIDTAGLDQSAADQLEFLSQQQTARLLPTADVLVLCWDSQQPLAALSEWAACLPQEPAVLVLGKADLAQPELSGRKQPWLRVSTANGRGLPELRVLLSQIISERSVERAPLPTGLTVQAVEDLEQIDLALAEAVLVAACNGGEELVAAELHRAIDRLGRLVGTIYTDDILDSIFSRFCIGK
ncbi:MAG: tRNA modification GTPase [Planctomycetaceae bacterium]|nr:tRNA modification GTPase [Planctomycetaceae bacterium]